VNSTDDCNQIIDIAAFYVEGAFRTSVW